MIIQIMMLTTMLTIKNNNPNNKNKTNNNQNHNNKNYKRIREPHRNHTITSTNKQTNKQNSKFPFPFSILQQMRGCSRGPLRTNEVVDVYIEGFISLMTHCYVAIKLPTILSVASLSYIYIYLWV